ncbi:MAG: stage II sporulation protein M, partial [Desulfobacteraceae bacterium]
MIIDLEKFMAAERPYWNELDRMMARQERDPYRRISFDEIKRLHYLYQRASADLSKIDTYSAEFAVRRYLESL